MTKKQQKQWLLNQIDLAILDVPGEYSIEGNHCVFRLPETTCVYKIWIEIADSVECRLNSLNRFARKINKPFVKQRNYFANNYNIHGN
jgi:hypothetical protein